MATIKEQAAAIKGYAAEIDAAIVAKGGTTDGGLRNAAAAIEALPSGGGEPSFPLPWKDDGKTHLWFFFAQETYPFACFAAQYISDGHTFFVDWGDGSAQEIAASTSYTTRSLSHVYSETGFYEVVIYGYDSIRLNQNNVFTSIAGSQISAISIRQAEFGGNVYHEFSGNFGSTAGFVAVKFHGITDMNGQIQGSYAMREAVWTENVKTIATNFAAGCTALKMIGDMPELVSIPYGSFSRCFSLVSIGDMPSLTSIDGTAFYDCKSLESIGDMSSLTTLASNSFSGNNRLRSLTFRSKTHSDVVAITGFTNFPNLGRSCVFHCSDGDYYRSGSNLLPL